MTVSQRTGNLSAATERKSDDEQADIAALGVVFGIVGVFLIVAAVRNNASAAKGLGGPLQELARQPYGHVILGIVAIGLIAYGLFSFTQARYRRLGTA